MRASIRVDVNKVTYSLIGSRNVDGLFGLRTLVVYVTAFCDTLLTSALSPIDGEIA